MRSFYIQEMVVIIISDSYYDSKDRKLSFSDFWISKKWEIDFLHCSFERIFYHCVHFLLLYLFKSILLWARRAIVKLLPANPLHLNLLYIMV